jgi:hypothetical protein
MLFCVKHLKTWASTQTYIEVWTLEFLSFFHVFSRTHMAPNSLKFQRPLMCCVSCLLVGCSVGLVFLVLWSEVEAPLLVCIRSLTSVILNSLYDNFGPQEGGMIKPLRMAMSRRWRNSFFDHFQVYLLME